MFYELVAHGFEGQSPFANGDEFSDLLVVGSRKPTIQLTMKLFYALAEFHFREDMR